MINRTYIARLALVGENFPNLDIMPLLVGSRAAPVADAGFYAGATVPPAAWVAANGRNWYYEIRSRTLRMESLAGQAAFTPRTRLGYHLSIVTLQNAAGTASNSNLLPAMSVSASFALAASPGAPFSASYGAPFADPAYGPVIRIWSAGALFPERVDDVLYQVNLSIFEARDEDLSNHGRS